MAPPFAYNAPPDSLADLRGPTLTGRGRGRMNGRRGREERRRRGNVEGRRPLSQIPGPAL